MAELHSTPAVGVIGAVTVTSTSPVVIVFMEPYASRSHNVTQIAVGSSRKEYPVEPFYPVCPRSKPLNQDQELFLLAEHRRFLTRQERRRRDWTAKNKRDRRRVIRQSRRQKRIPSKKERR